jgi:hypothetical protein
VAFHFQGLMHVRSRGSRQRRDRCLTRVHMALPFDGCYRAFTIIVMRFDDRAVCVGRMNLPEPRVRAPEARSEPGRGSKRGHT